MSDDIRIKGVTQLDLDVCRRLILGSEPWITLRYSESDIQAIVRSVAGSNLLVAHAGDAVVGFALSTPGVLLGEYLKLLAVDAAFRSRGIGRALMEELERRAFQAWPNIYLCVSDFNTAARQFYCRLGYAEVGILTNLLLADTNEVLMRKSIAPWKSFRESRDA